MRRRTKCDLRKHCLRLRDGDFDRIREAFTNVEAGVVIRELVIDFVDNRLPKPEPLDERLNLGDL